MEHIVNIVDVTKTYGSQTVLDNVNFTMHAGEIVGLVGPNGAGKTTLMKVMTGLIPSYQGEVYINGRNIKQNKRMETKQIGSVIETPGFYPHLTGYENLLYFAEISGVKDKNEINQIVKTLGIESYIYRKAKTYSLGMKQRLGVAQAVLTNPPLLILDEPTNGLDPEIVPQLRSFIKFMAEHKKTAVLISSHILSEIELMCKRVVFIQKGKIVDIEELDTKAEEIDNQKAYIAFETSQLYDLQNFFNNKRVGTEIINDNTLYVLLKPTELEDIILELMEKKLTFKYVYKVKDNLERKYLRTMGDYK